MPMRIFKLEEDVTGINPNNLVPNEPHVLPATGARFFVTKRGPFYAKSVKVYDAATNRLLIPRLDYDCIQLEVEQTALSGKEVCSIIIIRNEDVSANVLVTYQAFGGWLSYSVTAIVEMVEALELDVREITWGQIVGVPDRLPAAPHRHPLSDVYGWHKLFPGLGAIRDAILTGNQPVLDQLRDGFQAEIDRIDAAALIIRQSIEDHITATGNVHNLHAHDISTYLQSEINDLLNQRLPLQGIAYDTARLFGRNPAQFDTWIHSILSYSRITQGIVPAANRAQGYNPAIADMVVTQTGYVPFKTLLGRNQDEIKTAGMYWAGVQGGDAVIHSIYANNTIYPAPMLVGFNYYYETTHGYGNGGTYQVGHNNIRVCMKYAPGAWATISSD